MAIGPLPQVGLAAYCPGKADTAKLGHIITLDQAQVVSGMDSTGTGALAYGSVASNVVQVGYPRPSYVVKPVKVTS